MSDHEKTENEVEHAEHEHGEPAPPEPAPPPAPPRYAPPPAAPPAPPQEAPQQVRTPFLAAFFSFFPGLGNVYNGLYLRGITFFLIIIGLIALATGTREPESILMVFAIIFVWLFSIFDAYRQANLINLGYTTDVEMPDKPRFSSWGSGGLTAGIAVFLLGLYGFLREQLDIDLSLLVDYWYLLFMVFGGFLIAWTVIQRKKAEEGTAEEEGLNL